MAGEGYLLITPERMDCEKFMMQVNVSAMEALMGMFTRKQGKLC